MNKTLCSSQIRIRCGKELQGDHSLCTRKSPDNSTVFTLLQISSYPAIVVLINKSCYDSQNGNSSSYTGGDVTRVVKIMSSGGRLLPGSPSIRFCTSDTNTTPDPLSLLATSWTCTAWKNHLQAHTVTLNSKKPLITMQYFSLSKFFQQVSRCPILVKNVTKFNKNKSIYQKHTRYSTTCCNRKMCHMCKCFKSFLNYFPPINAGRGSGWPKCLQLGT